MNIRLLLLLPILLLADLDSAVEAKPTGLSANQVSELRADAKERELVLYQSLDNKFSEHKGSLERLVERHLGLFETTVNRMIIAYTALLGVIVSVLIWFVGSNRVELKKMLETWMKEDAQKLIDQAGNQLRRRMDSLATEMAALTDYKNKRIVWVCPPSTWKIAEGEDRNKKADSNQEIFAAFNSFGLHNIQILSPESADTRIELGKPDLVILSFDGTNEGRILLREIVTQLKMQSPPVFLIIETYSGSGEPHRLLGAEFKILDGFLWYVPVNFPAQLVAQVQLLIRRDTSRLGEAAHG